MNKRIMELAEQAFQPLNEITTEGVADRYTFEQAWFQTYNQKFAELIVKEYETFLPEICPWANAHKEGPMKGWHVEFVARKHFGVQE